MQWGLTVEQNKAREERLNSWHPWFAWHPVRLDWDKGRWVWLETVARNCYGYPVYHDISYLERKK